MGERAPVWVAGIQYLREGQPERSGRGDGAADKEPSGVLSDVDGLSVKGGGASPGQLRWRLRSCPPKSCFSVADATQVQVGKEGHILGPGECGNRAVCEAAQMGTLGRTCASQQLFRRWRWGSQNLLAVLQGC